MTNQLAIRDNQIALSDLGKILTQSGYFQDTRDASQAIVKVLAGQELGFGAIASMTGIHIIKGRVSLGANLIAAAVKRSGRYNYRVRKQDDDVCQIEFFERIGDKWESIGLSVFTASDAKRAGTQNMDKFPRNMLFARAMSNGAKWYCADVFGGPVYTPDELGALVDGETGEVIPGEYREVAQPEPHAQPAPSKTEDTSVPGPEVWAKWGELLNDATLKLDAATIADFERQAEGATVGKLRSLYANLKAAIQ